LPEERCCFNFLRVFTIGKPTANSQCLLILHRCPTRTAVQLPVIIEMKFNALVDPFLGFTIAKISELKVSLIVFHLLLL
jgi:hypothetical protein